MVLRATAQKQSPKQSLPKVSRSQMFFEIVVVKNFAIFTGKHLFESLFDKIARLKAIKRDSIQDDMVKHELRVTSYELLVTSWKLKSTSWKSKVRGQIHELWVQIHEFKSTSCESKSTSYEFKSKSYGIV